MSHIAKHKLQVTQQAVLEAAQQLGYEAHVGSARIYQTTVSGVVIRMPEFDYPVVFRDGQLHYDLYFSSGESAQRQLGKFHQWCVAQQVKLSTLEQYPLAQVDITQAGDNLQVDIELEEITI